MVLPAHAVKSVQVYLKAVSNEGHFTLEVETVFRPYLPYDWSGVTEQYQMVLTVPGLQAVQDMLKSVSNKAEFNLEDERVSCPYLP
jgi:hypothetical protein